MDNQKLLSELGKTPYGKALRAVLDEEISKLDTVIGTKDRSKEEDIGRELAIGIVHKLFSFMDKDLQRVDKTKNQYK